LASLGADDLYDGQLGKILLENLANRGGLFAGPEWRGFAPELAKPISMDYRGMRVYETAPPSQGIIVLEAMGILKGLDPAICSRTLSSDAVHFMVEALKIAFTDRNSGVADPVFHENRLDTVLSEQYLAAAFNRISPQKSTEIVNSPLIDGDTTYLCAVDADGNAISMIESVSHSFGAGFAVPGTGIVLNNRAGRGFSLEAGHPNVIEPGKRSMHTLNCYLATRGDDLWLVGGTPGGDLQPQCNVQMLTALIDGGLNPEEAVRLPRWTLFPGTDPEYVGQPWEIQVEADFPEDVFFELQARGHRLQRKPYWESPGAVQLIMVDPDTRIRQGASDHRTDGFVLGY
jgi:gamma-glutamyltranspeptidase/glutathione hydrolase